MLAQLPVGTDWLVGSQIPCQGVYLYPMLRMLRGEVLRVDLAPTGELDIPAPALPALSPVYPGLDIVHHVDGLDHFLTQEMAPVRCHWLKKK